jgi:hypothetical protein
VLRRLGKTPARPEDELSEPAGDPLADLGNARMEMAMLFGTAAQEDLTSQYRALMPDLSAAEAIASRCH